VINFDALVLGPAMATFARPITVTPLVSQPGEPAYGARGVWSSKPINVALEDGSILSSQVHTLGIRRNDRNSDGTPMFAMPIRQGDQIDIDAFQSLPRVGLCAVEDTDEDGQGGVIISVKITGA
jgi:hypothetical protein